MKEEFEEKFCDGIPLDEMTAEDCFEFWDDDMVELWAWIEQKIKEACKEQREICKLRIKLLAGRKRIMVGEAFSTLLSEPNISLADMEGIVDVYNGEIDNAPLPKGLEQ